MIDSDMLLVLVDSAERIKAPTSEPRLHYYAFFTKQRGIRFTYDFQVLKSLYSMSLHEDLRNLEEGRYLKTGSDFRLTDKGKEWLAGLPSSDIEKIQEQMIETIKSYIAADEIALFREAYATLTKGL